MEIGYGKIASGTFFETATSITIDYTMIQSRDTLMGKQQYSFCEIKNTYKVGKTRRDVTNGTAYIPLCIQMVEDNCLNKYT